MATSAVLRSQLRDVEQILKNMEIEAKELKDELESRIEGYNIMNPDFRCPAEIEFPELMTTRELMASDIRIREGELRIKHSEIEHQKEKISDLVSEIYFKEREESNPPDREPYKPFPNDE